MPKKDIKKIKKANPLQIQHFLGGIDYPVRRQALVDWARENGAPDIVVRTLRMITDREYTTPTEVTKAAAGQS